jgi:hypothetical protein
MPIAEGIAESFLPSSTFRKEVVMSRTTELCFYTMPDASLLNSCKEEHHE